MLGPEVAQLDTRPEAGLVVGRAIAVELLDPLAADVAAAHDVGARLLGHFAGERLLERFAGLQAAPGKAPIRAVPGDKDDPAIMREADAERLGRLGRRRPERRIEPRDPIPIAVVGVVRHAPHAVEHDGFHEQRIRHFTLTRLVAFQFYGCGGVEDTPLPPDFCGGRVLLAVHATTSTGEQADGLLEVNCQIHDPGGQAPPGTSEGVKVNARGINFNKHVTGDNLFVMLP